MTAPAHVRVLVVGAGFAGIGAAITLSRAGHEVLVLERGDDVGGTWRDNTYPGCACDVHSHLYSFSFAPNPRWTRTFSPQAEIQAYLRGVVDRFDVRRLIRFGTAVTGARWDEGGARWHVETSAGTWTADVLVSATGPLAEPKLPDLPGSGRFTGQVLHSARWRPGTDVRGRRVAVVGTGASAVQIVPGIAREVAALTVFQRTPAWVLPRGDRAVAAWKQDLYERVPLAQKAVRGLIYTVREAGVLGFVVQPRLLRAAERLATQHLHRQVTDPALRAALTPTYRAGCKRLLLSDDFYPTLALPHVELVPSGVAALDGDTVVATDGSRRRVDTVVLATGFEATDSPVAHLVVGRGGVRLADVWAREGMQALRGTAVAGFPNLFLLVGPNTGLGHTSMVHVIESQLNYLRDAVRLLDENGLAAIEPTPEAQQAWNADVQRRMAHTIWTTGGCRSWYQDERGRVTTLWPGSTLALRRRTRRLDPREYRATPRAGAGSAA